MRKMIATIAITASAIIIPSTIATAAPAQLPANVVASGWIKQAMAQTGVPAYWHDGLYTIAMRESGFNPNAVNNWDINAKNGVASQGLMQVLPPTFNAHHEPGTSWNILEPVANVSAAINYIKARYGDISNVQQANPSMPPAGY